MWQPANPCHLPDLAEPSQTTPLLPVPSYTAGRLSQKGDAQEPAVSSWLAACKGVCLLNHTQHTEAGLGLQQQQLRPNFVPSAYPDLPIRSRWGRVYSALEVPMVNAGEIRTHLRSLQRIAHTAISPRYTKIECRSPVNGVFGSCCVGKALRVLLFPLHCIACRPFSIL